MSILDALLWVLAALAEAAAASVFVRDPGAAWLPLALHVAAAATLTLAAWRSLPARYRTPWPWSVAFLAGLALAMPVLSWFGLLLALVPGLHWPRRQAPGDWEELPALTLPYQPVRVDARAVQRRGGLAAVLRGDEADWRVRAVAATRYLTDRRAVPILRIALTDATDEVRLLAYSLLSSKERRIDAAIQVLQEAGMGDAAAANAARAHEQLAGLYLEQAELGLAEGAVRAHALAQARTHIEAALRAGPSASRWFLQARIHLRLGRYPQADAMFAAAEQAGFSVGKVAPYRAECAFGERDVPRIREQLTRLDPHGRRAAVLAAVTEYWL